MPGNVIDKANELAKDGKKVVLGNGLRVENEKVIVTKSGIFCKRKNILYIDSYQKKYIPAKNDNIIGIIQSKTMDFFWVDINSPEYACEQSEILSLKNSIYNFMIISFQPFLIWHSKVLPRKIARKLM
jgi:exosome complex RNA-binding protein Rrp4